MEPQQITVKTKSDTEQIIDLVTTIVGLAILAYTLDPEPFDRILTALKRRANKWFHRVSVWQAIQDIRSLPETDET